mmetsp:Transcript_11831/g.18976  ORF Transcript_11831/g.18976 Transcript_11831/m.18976 type:complete len:98 (+) Transcript_11831:1273-1566(+)
MIHTYYSIQNPPHSRNLIEDTGGDGFCISLKTTIIRIFNNCPISVNLSSLITSTLWKRCYDIFRRYSFLSLCHFSFCGRRRSTFDGRREKLKPLECV